jgi:hypothetical protein
MNRALFRRLRHGLRFARRADSIASQRNEFTTIQSPYRFTRSNVTAFQRGLTTEQALVLSLTDGKPTRGDLRWSERIERKRDGLSKRVALRRALRRMQELRA